VPQVTYALLNQSQGSSADHKTSPPWHDDNGTPDSSLRLPRNLMTALAPRLGEYTCGHDGHVRVEDR